MGKTAAGKIVEAYLDRLHEIHRAAKGVKELSYRSALENLFTQIGEELDPKLQVTHELADTGSGRPDFGFSESKSGNMRGVVETKAPNDHVPQTADGAQVAKYWKQYRIVLVTNYRDFLLVACDSDNKPRVEGSYSLAADEEALWRTKPKGLSDLHAEGLKDFLIGVMKRSAPIVRPKDLADDLARHAREAKRRLERHNMSALAPLKEAMETALGLHFEGKEGEDFFRSSLVQTLFYGLFSGWMLWRQSSPPLIPSPGTPRAGEGEGLPLTPSPGTPGEGGGEGRVKKAKPPTTSKAAPPNTNANSSFDWKDAGDHLALPLIGNLYEEIARPTRLRDLDLREPLEWATTSLNRIVPTEFFKNFDQDHAITLFYEPFLEAFDPHLRKELGVWYTPPEIVKYMVGRVDQLLRSELGIADGLADESVYVLDPAAGTGSYVVEVARRIHQTLTEQGHGALAATKTKKALTTRVFGFEILPAPYVVAHLQLGVLLKELGTKLGGKDRCGIYLTNALTGWEPPKGAKETLAFHFLEDEQEAAARVKRETPIIVILGNPPYNGFAGVAQEEERNLLAPYFEGLDQYDVQVRSLNDLYIRFFRLAERRIAEIGGRGIVCFISNFSWLDGQSHPVMRKRLLDEFDQIWIDNCNGDKYRTGKRTPDGKSDQSMFTTDAQPVGIQVGTAIATMVKKTGTGATSEVRYRDLWGYSNDKRAALIASLSSNSDDYTAVQPNRGLRYIFSPGAASASYPNWIRLPELFIESFPGVKTSRDELLVDTDRDQLVLRMMRYFSASVSDQEMMDECPIAMKEGNRYAAAETRRTLVRRGFLTNNVVRFSYRPLDNRWLYWEPDGKLLDEKRTDYFPQVWPGNIAITAAGAIRKGEVEGPIPLTHLGCLHLIERGANVFPLLHQTAEGFHAGKVNPNIREELIEALGELVPKNTPIERAEKFFYHVVAVLWSPAYCKENEAALRQDWPRIPLPADATLLESSAKLGRAVADLLLPDKPVPGVTTGNLRPQLRTLAVPTKIANTPIEEGADTKVDAGCGFHGQKNAVMCGKGNVTPNKHGPENAVDIWINDTVHWANVPKDVWAMTIGGYPVVKKWLSYREFRVLARPLKIDELTYITEVVRRLKALLLLAPELDANYKACAATTQINITKAK